MKNRLFTLGLIAALFTYSGYATSQNLILNPSFELVSGYPPYASNNVYLATGWDEYLPSADFFHRLGGPGATTPYNWFGYQSPSDGDAYCGIYASAPQSGPNYREYIGYALADSLEPGSCYTLSFKFSLADKSRFAIKQIGAKTTLTPYSAMNNFAHIIADTFITDNTIWFTVSGKFMAEAPYKHVIIGNFFDDVSTDSLGTVGNTNYYFSYYLIDEVSLEKDTINLVCPCNNASADFDINTYPWEPAGTFNFYASSPVSNSFLWDLGDGTTSTDRGLNHFYNSAGTYEVCLITNNACGSDTVCKTISILATDNQKIELPKMKYYPNPFVSEIMLETDITLNNACLSIINILGQQVKKINNISGSSILISREGIPDGIYFFQLSLDNYFVKSEKVIIGPR